MANLFNQYVGNLQGSSPPLQGSSGYLQGSSPQLQGPTYGPPTPTPPKKITYGNTAATSPKQQYIRDLSSNYGMYNQGGNQTIYNKSTNTGFSSQGDFLREIGDTQWGSYKFDEGYRPPQQTSQPLNAPTSQPMNTPGAMPNTPTAPKADPYAGYKSAYQKYLDSLNPSQDYLNAKTKYLDFVNNAQTGIAGLEGQGRGIPLQIVRGEQAKLAEQSELTANRLQDDVNLASEQAGFLQNRSKAEVDFQKGLAEQTIADEDRATTKAEKMLASTAPALLAQLKTLKTPQQRDAYIIQKSKELGLSIDQVNSAIQGVMQKDGPIKLGEGDILFDPNTGQPIFKNPKTYDPNGGGTGGLTPFQMLSYNNTIQDNMRQDPAIKAYGELINSGIPQVIQSSKTNPQNVSDTLLMRALAKITDPTTGVREEEYRTFETAQGALGRLYTMPKNWIGRGRLTDTGRQAMISEIQSRFNALQSNYSSAYSYYANQLSPVGGTAPPLYGNGTNSGEDNDPLGLGFNSVGNTSASKPYLQTLGSITGMDGSSLWKYGLDVDLKIGDPVLSPVSGRVLAVSNNGGFGNQVKIQTADGKEIWLSHLTKGLVKKGDIVRAGQKVGIGGNTGNTIPGKGGDGSHLDITMKSNGKLLSAREVYKYLSNKYV